jgi:hypothetical protein
MQLVYMLYLFLQFIVNILKTLLQWKLIITKWFIKKKISLNGVKISLLYYREKIMCYKKKTLTESCAIKLRHVKPDISIWQVAI